jgi:hypothetical protein
MRVYKVLKEQQVFKDVKVPKDLKGGKALLQREQQEILDHKEYRVPQAL